MAWQLLCLAPLLVLLFLVNLPRCRRLQRRCEEERRSLKVAEAQLSRQQAQREKLAAQLKVARARLAKQGAAIAKEIAYQSEAQASPAAEQAAGVQLRAEAEELQRLAEVLLLCITWSMDWHDDPDEGLITASQMARADYHTAFAEALAPGAAALVNRRSALRRSVLAAPVIDSEEVLQQCAGAQLENVVSSALEGLHNAVAWWRS
mmetsp:Transcript_9607/g.16627  ORF Transcript_9607/g.16627 Transcript_9607/m.16627 type:complete len:206 (-) Transcript_9607:10-627(-)